MSSTSGHARLDCLHLNRPRWRRRSICILQRREPLSSSRALTLTSRQTVSRHLAAACALTFHAGHLPYLVHGSHTVAGFDAIVSYLAAHAPGAALDAPLTPAERAVRTAWGEHVRSAVGDLVAHNVYAPGDSGNFTALHAALVARLPVPQRYYLPLRLRLLWQPRLENAAMWDGAEEAKEMHDHTHNHEHDRKYKGDEKADAVHVGADTIRKTFARERVRK